MKRILAVLLCLLMCVSMLPVAAFAEGADIIGVDEIEEHEHSMEFVPAVEPFFKPGHSAYYYCVGCGGMYADADGDTELAAADVFRAPIHTKPTDSKKIKVTPATCTRNGKMEYICADEDCNVKGIEVIPAHGVEVYHGANAPTCFASGNIEYYQCSECGRIYADAAATQELQSIVVPALTHSLVKVEAKNATCAEAGNVEHWKCEYCGTLFANAEGTEVTTAEAVAIPKLQHTLTKTEAHAATCEAGGNIEYWTCSGCGKLFRDEAADNEIQLSDTVIEKLDHDLEEVPAKPACLEDGNIQYWVCKRENCGKLFSDAEGTKEIALAETVVSKIGHHDFEGGVCKVCRVEDPDYKGPTLKDSNLSIVAGEGLVIRVDADFDTTMAKDWSIAIDGETISKDYIDVTRGSTVFHIDGIALDSLEPGTYNITITIGEESVTGQLVVEAPPTTYKVNIPTMENGEVTVDKATAAKGETVTLTVSPDSGFVLKKNSLSVKSGTTGITLSPVSGDPDKYTFIMPDSEVNVSAEFVKEFTVTFDTVLPISTIAKPTSIKVQEGDTIAAADMPEPEDSAKHHDFKGWYKDKDYKTPFKAGTDTITADTTLYAKWTHDYPDSKDKDEGKGICPYCWEADHSFTTGVKDPDFTAEIVRGNGKTAHYGSYFPMTVNTYYRYVKGSVEVKVDGKTLSEDKYTVYAPKHGTSTVVELDRAYIRKLPVGKYAISIKTNLGTAKGIFWVSSSPKTADDSNVALYVTVGVISAAAVAGIAYYLIKKRRK